MWLKRAINDRERIEHNIYRLDKLCSLIHELAYFVIASNSGGFNTLKSLLNDSIVRGRPRVLEKLQSALIGENHQKIALDAPMRFQKLMLEAESLIKHEIGQEKKKLRKITIGQSLRVKDGV